MKQNIYDRLFELGFDDHDIELKSTKQWTEYLNRLDKLRPFSNCCLANMDKGVSKLDKITYYKISKCPQCGSVCKIIWK